MHRPVLLADYFATVKCTKLSQTLAKHRLRDCKRGVEIWKHKVQCKVREKQLCSHRAEEKLRLGGEGIILLQDVQGRDFFKLPGIMIDFLSKCCEEKGDGERDGGVVVPHSNL